MPDIQFSIVIPSYNSQDYIMETILSIHKQTYQPLEVIIIDDWSTDATVAVARQAMAEYGLNGTVIVKDRNAAKGVAASRNMGAEMAKGEWICFLDSDDLFLPEKLAKTASLIEQHSNDCKAYLHTSREFEDETGKTICVRGRNGNEGVVDLLPELVKENYVTTSAVTISRQLIQDVGGFDTTLHGVEDYMFWLRVSKRTKWYSSREPLTDYRVRATSLMSGREMSYYVTQNANLVRSAKAFNEFTPEELASIDHYLFDETMGYYALVALNGRGWGDFIKGLKALMAEGRRPLAIELFRRHFKNALLKKLIPAKK